MPELLSSVAILKILNPLLTSIYSSASGKAKAALQKWAASSGIKKAATTLLNIEKVKTIWSPEDEISLQSFYYPSKLFKARRNGEEIFIENKNIESLPSGNIVIEGIVGQGKSIFMRHLAASSIRSPTLSAIPAFLELRTISSKRNLTDLIINFLESLGISPAAEAFEYLASSEKIILLLDGFDEIPSECVSDIILEIETLQTRYPKLKIIISSRPRNHIQNVVGFQVLHISRLDPSDYDLFISKLIHSPAKRFDVVDALHSCSDSIKGVISTPLMLTLLVIVYQTEKEIPSTLSDFFEKLFGIVFTKHDRLKAGFNRQHHTKLSERKLKQLFDAFCFMAIHLGGGRSLENSKFEQSFDSAIEYLTECKCELEDFRNDIVKVACLMVEEGFDTTTFLHKSILDYHAASFVKSQNDARAKSFYRTAFNNFQKWASVIEFLNNIDPVRYAKYYSIECLTPLLTELTEVIKSDTPDQLISYIEKYIPDLNFQFEDGSLVQYGSDYEFDVDLINAIQATLPHSIADELEDHKSEIKLHDLINPTRRSSKDSIYKLSFPKYIEIFGQREIISTLNELHYEYQVEIIDAESKVLQEQSKESLFADILEADPEIREGFGR